MNLVQGDWIRFTLPVWAGGSVRMLGRRRVASGKPTVTGHETYAGAIEREWYDANQRHWFSVRLDSTGKLKRVQGRNLYSRIDEHRRGDDHDAQAREKHTRKVAGIS